MVIINSDIMILYDMHDIVIYHACFMAWNGLNDVIMIYCLNTVYHAGVSL